MELKYFKENLCEGIIVAGGGSAIDVAKCIKLFSNMDTNINYLKQSIVPNDVKLLAISNYLLELEVSQQNILLYIMMVKNSQ